MVTRQPYLLLFARAARAAWWCGLPLLFVAYVVLGPEFYQFEPLYGVANRGWPVSPLAAELLAEYPLWIIAMLLLTVAMLWSHYRRAALVRIESLALPAYIGGIEACDRVVMILGCRGGAVASRAELQQELYVAASAGLITMTAPLLLGAIVKARLRHAVSGSFSPRSLLPVLAAIAAVTLQWMMYDLVLRKWAPT
jgi:hypothetical protein